MLRGGRECVTAGEQRSSGAAEQRCKCDVELHRPMPLLASVSAGGIKRARGPIMVTRAQPSRAQDRQARVGTICVTFRHRPDPKRFLGDILVKIRLTLPQGQDSLPRNFP